jgi:transcriptional regulator with XRE-family HTH domain
MADATTATGASWGGGVMAKPLFDPLAFGWLVAEARKNKGWNQSELAKKVNCIRTTITNIEAGRQRPSLEAFFQLVVALGIDMKLITDGDLSKTLRKLRIEALKEELDQLKAQEGAADE